ncbi:MAG: TetR/AcrR family transcriptional regulator [Clostridiales bacterium]|jgi:AcrR family transcriptional regulator|nr:TetR/AcrR family transcriptional regulator [Clostridiales bacterium]MDR2752163.1 TetR/AcrR family transcriptional regulator [Clostridiales bacterium]
MDLRVSKTQESIQAQFLSQRKTKPLNKVSVKILCEKAKVNKSTFYRHYRDVFDLSDKMEAQLVKDIIMSFYGIECLFNDPGKFIKGLLEAIAPFEGEITTLFRGRLDVFTEMFETSLKKKYQPESPSQDIKLSFIVGGAARAFLNTGYDYETIAKSLEDILREMPYVKQGQI